MTHKPKVAWRPTAGLGNLTPALWTSLDNPAPLVPNDSASRMAFLLAMLLRFFSNRKAVTYTSTRILVYSCVF